MPAFYHIYLSPRKDISMEVVEKIMDVAIDWYRYDNENWIIYTNSDANKWYVRLENVFNPGGRIFICKLNIEDYSGFMNKDFWEWISAKKQNR